MSDHIIVLPRDDAAALMAAIADLEQTVDSEAFGEFTFWTDGEYGRGGGEEVSVKGLFSEPIRTLSRIASDIDQQISTQ